MDEDYRPEELFDARAGSSPTSRHWRRSALAGWARILTPTAVRCLRELHLPDFRRYAVTVPAPGVADAEDTRVLGHFLRDVIALNDSARNFRLFGPDETVSNRLDDVFAATSRQWVADTQPGDQVAGA